MSVEVHTASNLISYLCAYFKDRADVSKRFYCPTQLFDLISLVQAQSAVESCWIQNEK
jgi:hypothetical protein